MPEEPEHLIMLKQALGAELASHRKAARVTQQYLAHQSGYSRSSITHAEAGRQLLGQEFWRTADRLVNADGRLLARYHEVMAAIRTYDDTQIATLRAGAAVPADGEVTNVSRDATGKVQLAAGTESASGHRRCRLAGLTPDDAHRLRQLANKPREVDHGALDSLAVVLAESRRLEDAIGAAPLVESTNGHLRLMERLVFDARGAIRPGVVSLAAQYAQFGGWLQAATDQVAAASKLFDRTLEWATECGDVTMVTTALNFKDHLAYATGRVGPMIGLSRAAQRNPDVHPSERAFAAMQEARGHAMVGDSYQAERKLDDADEFATQANERRDDAPPWVYFQSPAFWVLQRGVIYRYLGRNSAAADLLSAGLDGLPVEQHDAEWLMVFRQHLDAVRILCG